MENIISKLLNPKILQWSEFSYIFRWICENGKVEALKQLIKIGVDITSYNNIAIRCASKAGQTEIVRLLIESGVDVTICINYPIRVASENGHIEVVKLLIKAGAKVKACYDYSIRKASQNGHTEVVKLLIYAGANAKACNNYAMQYAKQNGYDEVIKLLVGAGADINADNQYESKYDFWDKLKNYDEQGNRPFEHIRYDLDVSFDCHRIEDFEIAIKRKDIDEVRRLLKLGVDVTTGKSDALRLAYYYGSMDIVNILLQWGADGTTILPLATKQAEDVKLLIESGADVTANDNEAIREASKVGNVEVVKMLIQAGVSLDVAFKAAVEQGQTEVIDFLIIEREGK